MSSQLVERLRKALAPEYVIERQLATGGMGIVFLAREPALDRLVAIKVLRPELATATSVERFLREARLLAAANHPNIVPIHRVGVADGIAFFVMDYLEGATLADRLAAGRLPPVEVIRIGRDILRAVSAAHALGIVHRDIKPSNIFLTPHGALLADFGVSKRDTEDSDITSPGAVPGTPAYMAPEQIAGVEATPATDLYAVAMSLYEAATGRRWEHPAHVRDADWRGVPRALARTLRGGLTLEAGRRWPSATSFGRALRRARVAPYVRRTVLLAVVGLMVGIAGSQWVFSAHARSSAMQYDLAILPLASLHARDSVDAEYVSRLAMMDLDWGSTRGGVTVVPAPTVFGWAAHVPTGEWTPDAALDALPTRTVAVVTVDSRGESLNVALKILEADGTTRAGPVITGVRANQDEIASSVAFELVRLIDQRKLGVFREVGMPESRSVGAMRAYLRAEHYFEIESWDGAERNYEEALALDSTFAAAWWGLYNVERWERGPTDVDLASIRRRYWSSFNERDRLLIRAELAPAGPARFAVYDTAVMRFPRNAYVRLLYGNELFNRGALYGIALDSAVAMLRSAAARDSFLGPVQSTLTWALIRQGRREESRRTLNRYAALASGMTTGTFSLPAVLELAWSQRFPGGGSDVKLADALEDAQHNPSAAVDLVLHTLRWAPSLELSPAELAIADSVIAMPGLVDSIRLNAFEAKGVALAALGRVDSAVVAFDSAAAIGATPEYRLQAGQWRLLPAALGVTHVTADMRETGQRMVARLLDEPSMAARAAWTLGVDALAHGDTAAGAQWRARLAAARDSLAPRLAAVLDGLAAAVRRDYASALSSTAPLGAYDDKARGGDPFVRSILHFNRGLWLAETGRNDAADRTWRWYLNADVVDWPTGPVQAAEIDWVSEGIGALSRARLLATHDRTRACALYEDAARHWAHAEGAMVPLADEARANERSCT